MGETLERAVRDLCHGVGNDSTRLMDIVRAVQARYGCVSDDAIDVIASAVAIPRVEVESVVSFYAFLSKEQKGRIVIRLCNDVVDRMKGVERVAEALSDELGLEFGETSKEGAFTLEWAPCIGMCDQAPAAMVNDVIVTNLSSEKARELVRTLRKDPNPRKLVQQLGSGNNAHALVQAMVSNHLRQRGPVVFADLERGKAIRKAIVMSPQEVIRDVKTARLRGRGGAGFPTGMKWEFTRAAVGERRIVVCNADEGEPGTFKDRVVLTEAADLLFEGMTIAGYAIGADLGLVYLRGEYAYLKAYLENVLAERRAKGLLGKAICGKAGFDYDIRIQMGAGAYICGEETALLSSCEGKRGDPKNRPPFPAQKGYLGHPTTVNNVETFCCVARILDQGPGWFAQFGSKGSTGTKLLSISGDCRAPGVYEVPFGITLAEVLKLAGADDAAAVQVGGPSGQMVGPAAYGRTICYDDLATGGSIVVFGPERDLLAVAAEYMEFFVDESCGYCTPCRVGNTLLLQRLNDIRAGRGSAADLEYLESLGATIKTMSRCGLGQTSANPVMTTLKNFRSLYEAKLKGGTATFQPTFDLGQALKASEDLTGRKSVHFAETH
jgi:[NiFe] hydrogenase diaphorase moiety large subunit